MILRSAYSREILKVWAKWGSASVAAIPSGLLLGLMLKQGVAQKPALVIALTFGGVMAVLAWKWMGRLLAPRPVAVSFPLISPARVEWGISTGTLVGGPAIASTVLCLFSFSQPGNMPCAIPIFDQPSLAVPVSTNAILKA